MHKAISVIKSFTLDELELGPTDISRKTGIPLTTTHRILTTLTKERILEKDPGTRKYRTGPELYIQGALYLKSTNLQKVAAPVMKEMNNLTGEVVNLAIFNNGYITILLREETKHHLRLSGYIGFTSPAYANATGKVILSEFSDAQIDEIYPSETLRPLTKKTVATKTELKRELEQIRKTGAFINIEQVFEGEAAIASVIHDSSGTAVASLAIAVPTIRMNKATEEKLVELVKLGASSISYRLGYQDTDNPAYTIEEIRSWWEQSHID